MLRRTLAPTLAVLALTLTAAAAHAQTVVYLVRHAEPELPGDGRGGHEGSRSSTWPGRSGRHALRARLRQAGITES